MERLAQPLRFGAVGVVNTLVGLSVIYGLKLFAGLGDVAANLSGYALGLVVSFVLNARWTFGYRGAIGPAAARFLIAFALAYLANLASVLALIDGLGADPYLAHALAVAPYAVTFYLVSRAFVFRRA